MGKVKNDTLINISYKFQSRISSAISIFLIGISIFIFLLTSGCKDGITNPVNSIGDLCYEKFVNNHWEIFTNNIAGTNPLYFLLNTFTYIKVDDGTLHQLEDEAHGPSWNPQQ